MKTQIRIFFAALMFFTRLPCPRFGSDTDAWQGYLNRSCRYFSLIGFIVGGIGFGVYAVCNLFLPVSVSVWCSLAATILATGGFHEDGLADVCDGFGGGWNTGRILEIMKDSRLGTFGVLGLVVSVGLKQSMLTVLLSEYATSLWAGLGVFLLSHSLSRAAAATYIYVLVYVRADLESKAKPLSTRMSGLDLFLVWGIGLLPLCFFLDFYMYFGFVLFILPFWIYLRNLFVRWLGGYTGDCLGAAHQIFELVIVLILLAVGKLFISP